jgi:hypothetical protein
MNQESKQGLLDRYKEDILNKEIPGKIKEVHDKYDESFKNLGFERKQDEKTYHAVERILKEQKERIEALAAAGKGGQEYENKLQEFKRKQEEIESNAQKTIAEKDKELEELRNKYQMTEKQTKLQEVFAPIKAKFKSDLPSYFQSHERTVLNEVLKNTAEKDGKLIMLNSDGSEMKDNSFNNVTAESYLAEQFKDVFKDERKPQGGTGANGSDPNKDTKNITVESFVLPPNVKTRGDLMNYLVDKGLDMRSKPYLEIYNKHKEKLSVM